MGSDLLPDLLTAYHEDALHGAASVGRGARLQLSGLVGSSANFAASHHRAAPGHPFVLNDKEGRLLLNDLQTSPGKDRPEPLFFPAPVPRSLRPEGHHDGERVTRTEVLEGLDARRPGLTIVTHAEALAPLVVGLRAHEAPHAAASSCPPTPCWNGCRRPASRPPTFV